MFVAAAGGTGQFAVRILLKLKLSFAEFFNYVYSVGLYLLASNCLNVSLQVQLAKQAGCHVIGTCSSDEKVEFLKVIVY